MRRSILHAFALSTCVTAPWGVACTPPDETVGGPPEFAQGAQGLSRTNSQAPAVDGAVGDRMDSLLEACDIDDPATCAFLLPLLLARGAHATEVLDADPALVVGVGACTHGACTQGGPLTQGCSSCANTVCNVDSYCCTITWDSICVNEAKQLCGTTCAIGGNCAPATCAAKGVMSCGSTPDGCGGMLNCGTCATGSTCTNNVCMALACVHGECASGQALAQNCSSCVNTVCAVDGYCCTTSWDTICVNEAKQMCGKTCN
ncbi:hypothetical protein [Corallococcus sp. Z5C101001]|uniref:hypothetical protein n=1 Tax=Corallococcus sp. Z5C101001 TaxID=2596829 RepID=UPI00117F093D|nr:hypothetical protein [Corallococcus sp. Z5C101001]TSC29297.1 hypothetical protein FOF48_15300 [Corallococcus sp. Z5C101001]